MMKQFKVFWLLIIWFSVAPADSIVIDAYNEQRDWPAIERIIAANYYMLAYESDGVSPEGTTKSYFDAPSYITQVVRIANQTVGFINYAAFERDISGVHVVPYGFINLIGIDNQQQGKGYGRLLLETTIEEFKKRNMPFVFIYASPQNPKALNLYESVGFRLKAADQFFDEETDYLYQLCLNEKRREI